MRQHLTHRSVQEVRRTGAIVVIVLVALIVTGAMVANLVKLLVSRHQQLELQHKQLQADWLAESARMRGRTRLAEQPDYTGETWTVNLHGPSGPTGTAVIEVEAATKKVIVHVTVPSEDPQPVRE